MANRTGILGGPNSDPGDLVLGGGPLAGDLVASTSGLLVYYPCDDPIGKTVVSEYFGRNATINSAGDPTAYLSVAGISGNALQTPVATAAVAPPPFTKTVTPHISFDYGGADISIGSTGTIEMWIRFQELGDQQQGSGGTATPGLPYQCLKLSQSTNNIVFQVENGNYESNGGIYDLPVIAASWVDHLGSTQRIVFALADPPSWASAPAAELNHWYYLVFEWDGAGVVAYCNNVNVASSSHWPPSYTAANFSFGGLGAQYDMVAITNRRLTPQEIAARYAAGLGTAPSSNLRLTNFFVNAVAGYSPSVRITKGAIEVLRTGSRSARITKTVVEVLRTVANFAPPTALSASDTVTFSNVATGGRGMAAADTVTFVEGAGFGHTVSATDTVTFSDSGHIGQVMLTASDTLVMSDVVSRIGSHALAASDAVTFSDAGDSHNTIIRLTASDTFSVGSGGERSGDMTVIGADNLTLSDRAVSHSDTLRLTASDSVTFADSGGLWQTYTPYAGDELVFSEVAHGGNLVPLTASDTLTVGDLVPGYPQASDTFVIGDAATVFQSNARGADTVQFSDTAEVKSVIPNQGIGLSLVLRSRVEDKFPNSYCNTPDGVLMIANGIDPMLRWNPGDKSADTAGVIAPRAAVTLTATPFVNTDVNGNVIPSPSYTAYVRFLDLYDNPSDLSPISDPSAGEAPFAYTNVPVPAETKVRRRQILRNTAGEANVYYIEIDTDDLASTTFTGTMDDETLLAQTPVTITANDGSLVANVYGPPPSWKSNLVYQQGRLFAAVDVDYSVGNAIVAQGSPLVVGVGTAWTPIMAGRAFWVVGADDFYTVAAVDDVLQQLTLTANWRGADDQFAQYTIRPQPSERRLVYYTEAGVPEGWPPTYAIEVPEDGDELTALVSFNSFLFILESRTAYKFTFNEDPQTDGTIFNSTNRGVVNARCAVVVNDNYYMLDEQGVYKFDGATATPVSQPIQNVFQRDPDFLSINWKADTRLWHAAWDSAAELIRWFVSFGCEDEPRTALVYQYNLERWWIERYDRPITSSGDGLLGNVRSFAGSTGRSILVFSEGTLDGVPENVPARSGVASATPVSLSATVPGTVAPSMVDFPVGIASGRGRGQVRTVVGTDGGKLVLDRPLMVAPDETSVFQAGGFAWEWRSGWFRFADDEEDNPRDVEVVYFPTRVDANFVLNLYYNHDAMPREWATSGSDNGVVMTGGNPDATVGMKDNHGYMMIRQSGHRELYVNGDRFVAVALAGVAAPVPVRISSITIDGVSQ